MLLMIKSNIKCLKLRLICFKTSLLQKLLLTIRSWVQFPSPAPNLYILSHLFLKLSKKLVRNSKL